MGDALRTFDPVLAQLARAAKHGGFKAFSDENQVQKSYDRMLALYACCLALAPGHVVDDGVMHGIRDKYGDKYRMLARNDQPTFEAMLAYASPKHIVPSIPDYNQPLNASKDAFHQQLRLFNGEVAFHARVAELRSYLKLYSSIGIEKLAGFHDEDVPSGLQASRRGDVDAADGPRFALLRRRRLDKGRRTSQKRVARHVLHARDAQVRHVRRESINAEAEAPGRS